MTLNDAQRTWSAVDELIEEVVVKQDAALAGAVVHSEDAGLPAIAVSPAQGKLLQVIAEMCSARSILEIGTLGGYSTIWMARALASDGRIVTLEISAEHAAVARRNFETAGVADVVDLRVGPALESLPGVEKAMTRPFDMVFIDADKPNNPAYLEWAIRLTRGGGVIVVDNVIRDGEVLDAGGDASVQGSRKVLQMLGADPRLCATAIQTVGMKGYDGFAIAVVKGRRS